MPGWEWDAVLLSVVLLIPGVWFSSQWLRLFPLVEFRQQAFFNLPFQWLWDQITFEGSNIWSVPFYFNSTLGHVCDTNVGCYNAALLSLNLITAVLVYTLVRRMVPWRLLAAFAATIFLLSVPVLDSLAWQATNLDKLSALLVMAGLHIGLSFYRRGFSRRACWWANGVLFVLVVLSQNSKSAAWVLVPMLFLLPVAGGGQRLRTWWRYLIAPTAYAIPQSIHVLQLIRNDAFYSAHVSDGDVPRNAQAYVSYLGGLLDPSPGVLIAATVAVGVIVVGLVRRAPHARVATWMLLGVVGSLVIPVRTVYPSPFYMVVPAALTAVLLVLVVALLLEMTPREMWLAPAVLALVAFGLYCMNVSSSEARYDLLESSSANYRAALPVIAAHVRRDQVKGLILALDASNSTAYRMAPDDVEQFIWGDKTAFNARVVTSPPTPLDVRHWPKDMAVATFDGQMHLTRVIVNGRVVARVPSGG